MWADLQYPNWIDRGQQPVKQTAEEKMLEFERLKKEAGAK